MTIEALKDEIGQQGVDSLRSMVSYLREPGAEVDVFKTVMAMIFEAHLSMASNVHPDFDPDKFICTLEFNATQMLALSTLYTTGLKVFSNSIKSLAESDR